MKIVANGCTITTNYHRYPVIYGFELPEKVKKDFDYLSEERIMDRKFVHYKGHYYDLGEFTVTDNIPSLSEWDGYTSDSAFSGTLIKMIDSENDFVLMGWYYS